MNRLIRWESAHKPRVCSFMLAIKLDIYRELNVQICSLKMQHYTTCRHIQKQIADNIQLQKAMDHSFVKSYYNQNNVMDSVCPLTTQPFMDLWAHSQWVSVTTLRYHTISYHQFVRVRVRVGTPLARCQQELRALRRVFLVYHDCIMLQANMKD